MIAMEDAMCMIVPGRNVRGDGVHDIDAVAPFLSCFRSETAT
jgi:hypothetical protein